MDAQGADVVRPYADPKHAGFPTVIDADNVLGSTFGFKAIPNGLLIGADKRLDGKIARGFDIRKAETRELVERWLAADAVVEHPERFYAGDVDYAWQREQMETGR